MKRKIKVLTVCDKGINRSVVLASLLKWDYDTISMGTITTEKDTAKMLFEWAEVIIVVTEGLKLLIPKEYKDKVKVYDVGEDRFPRPFNLELVDYFKRYLEKDPIK